MLTYTVSGELMRVLQKALSKNPDHRYASARAMTADLQALSY
jgi:hypothetical protein